MSALSSREASTFKIMMGLYDNKNYSKALKAADQILKKSPDHGETTAMKALLTYYLDSNRKVEALTIAKRAIKLDIKSSLCWHILAIIYKGNGEYGESAKCFAQASRINPTNHVLLQESSILYLQLGQIENFRKTRAELLNLRPGNINHWVIMAFAFDLSCKTEMAVEALTECSKQFDLFTALNSFQATEVILYQATCMEAIGQYSQALELLESNLPKILDITAYYTILGRLELRLGHYDKVHGVYRKLFKLNSENLPTALLLLASHSNYLVASLFGNEDFIALKTLLEDSDLSTEARYKLFEKNMREFQSDSAVKRPDMADYAAYCITKNIAMVLGDQVYDINKVPNNWSVPQRQYLIMDRYSNYLYKKDFRYITTTAETEKLIYRTKPAKKWDDLPVFYQTRELTDEEFDALLEVLDELKAEFSGSHVLEQLKIALMPPKYYKKYCLVFLDRAFSRCIFNISQYLSDILSLEKIFITIESTRRLLQSSDKIGYIVSAKILLASLYYTLDDYDSCLLIAEDLINIAPTCLDLYTLSAYFLAKLGGFLESADFLVKACKIDGSDRDSSVECAKALARVGRIEEAIDEWTNYLKHEIDEGSKEPQLEIPSFRFEKEVARGYMLLGKPEAGFDRILKALEQFYECRNEQSDFYNYSLSRLSISSFKSYIYLLDDLYNSKYFQHFIKLYLRIGITHSLINNEDITKILQQCRNCLDPSTILELYLASYHISKADGSGQLFRYQCIYRILQHNDIYSRHSIRIIHHFLNNCVNITCQLAELKDELLEYIADRLGLDRQEPLLESFINKLSGIVGTLPFSSCLGILECEGIGERAELVDSAVRRAEELITFKNKPSIYKIKLLIGRAEVLNINCNKIKELSTRLYPKLTYN